ncbi:MAG: bifunctional phosphoribosylaminoimidazolecarboxamide formyltransferase/IMP cyclohydrolase [Propionibacteriaceae bacterium]
MTERLPLKRALISVYDKTGIEQIGRALAAAGIEIVSTGSTAKTLAEAGISVIPVESITNFPECFDDRVKTLHPLIHGGLLADRRKESHVAQMAELGVVGIDLLISNLYPFSETVATGAGIEDCIAKIDIGGPAMVRAAAKNHASVAVITSPDQYEILAEALAQGGTTLAQRQRLAAEAYVHTASYDVAVATWMGSVVSDTSEGDGFPAWAGATWTKQSVLRYGENSHQQAALYLNNCHGGGLASAEQFGGKEMSYNNYVDTDAARRAAYDHDEPCVAVVKHNNPCGIAIGADIAQAHCRAHECDPVSAYGGVIACNRPVSVAMAQQVKPIFTEVIVAPGYEPGALEMLQTKKNLRILQAEAPMCEGVELRHIDGGLLMQQRDVFQGDGDSCQNWTLVAGEAADEATLRDLQFAWRAVRAVKSNAILLAKDGASVGVGMGQVNRVDSARLAVARAGERAMGAVAASDAFFPFADGAEIVIDGGVKAIVQPGGSIRDEEVIAVARERGVTMYFTGNRHFAH